jgi:hypothetical protein
MSDPAHLPRHSVGTEACCLSDLPELAEHVVTIKGHPDSRSEDKAMILPERSGQQPVLGLAARCSPSARTVSRGRNSTRLLFGVLVSAVARTAR